MRLPTTLALVALIAAGCSSPSQAPADVAPTTPPTAVGLSLAASAQTWSLTQCEQARVPLRQPYDQAAEGVPPDYQVAGDPIATVELRAGACTALVVGNQSVVQPFHWAAVYHYLKPVNDSAGEQDVFLRELVVSDVGVAAALAAFGFPATVGRTEVVLDVPSPHITVEAEGVAYDVRAAAVVPTETVDFSLTSNWRGGDDHRLFSARLVEHLAAESTVLEPVVLRASSGYLAGAFAAGLQPATMARSTSDGVLTFQERFL